LGKKSRILGKKSRILGKKIHRLVQGGGGEG
jgi:hypothetical protein